MKMCGKRNRKDKEPKNEKKSSFPVSKYSDVERMYHDEIEALDKDASSMRGRDAKDIIVDLNELEKRINDGCSGVGKEALLRELKKVHSECESEDKMERWFNSALQLVACFCTMGPMVVTFVEIGFGYLTRATLVVSAVSMAHQRAVITGGCGEMGLELALLLAHAGAGVVLGCRPGHNATDQLRVETWDLDLSSLESTRAFAGRYLDTYGELELLVHNAATKDGCEATDDGQDHAVQVNVLGPALLTDLLLPALDGGRIVHVLCDAGLDMPDWLPFPLRRNKPANLPRISELFEGEYCDPMSRYANTKLALAAYSQELGRRHTSVTSLAVNPGSMDTAFGRAAAASTAVQGERGWVRTVMSMVSPASLIHMARNFVARRLDLGRYFLRPPEQGALAVFHTSTAPSLRAGVFGGFDQNCGRPFMAGEGDCGRLEDHKLPQDAVDPQIGKDLYDKVANIIHSTSPLLPTPRKKKPPATVFEPDEEF